MIRIRFGRRRGAMVGSAAVPLVFLAASIVDRAHAQMLSDLPDATFRPTRGVFVPEAARAGDADATAVELNPGQLGLVRHGDVAGIADLWNGNAAMPGRGAALLLAAPVTDGVGVGAGLQHLFAGGGWRIGGYTKLQLGLGLGGRDFGLGMSWSHLFGGAVAGVDTVDLGASARLFSRAALAFVIEDLNRPRLPNAADSVPRRWIAELGLRPLGTDRLEVGAAALHVGGDAWARLGSRFRAGLRVGDGWRLFTDVEIAPVRPDLSTAVMGGDGSDVRVTAGVAALFDHTTLALAGRRAFVPDGAPGARWGGSLVLHRAVERDARAAGPATVVRLTLRHLESDRAFVAQALRLRALASDTGIAAVLLKIDDLDLGVGRIEELRDLVSTLRARGKTVVAYVTYPSTRDLYLAAACDRVVIHPAGVVTFAGLAQTVTFYKAAMDRLGVSMDLIRIAEFKGAMEPFVMTGQSEAVKRNRNDLLDDVYGRILHAVEIDRQSPIPVRSRMLVSSLEMPRAEPAPKHGIGLVDFFGTGVGDGAVVPLSGIGAGPGAAGVRNAAARAARMQALIAHGSFTPDEAKEAGLVDAALDDNEVEPYLRVLLDRPTIQIEAAPDTAPVRRLRWPGRRLAVILVDGTIADGSSQEFPFGAGATVGSDTLVAALDECRRDASVRAVVLRVNSPGGSAFASDVVARAVARLRAGGKPVVVSMGDVAASGGYYIAAPSDAIFAEPSTTTGSIGIFGYKLDVAGLMSALSLHTEVYKRGAHADAASPFRPWTPEERASAEKKLRHLYEMFLATVAAGRQRNGLSVARVDELGRGHVYTGAQARPLGLVDELGGVTAAIDHAAKLGRLPLGVDEAPELLVLPRPTTSLLQMALGLASTADTDGAATTAAAAAAASPTPLTLAPALRPIFRLVAPYVLGPGEGIEARLPFDLETK